jgi:hydroxymethylpyrimidine pyrophosphatase-like HAD family hydrolase
MIRFAQIGIAMGNATNLLKSNSDYVTASVDDDGVLKALAYYQLI